MAEEKSKAIQWLAISIIVASVIISGTILYTNSNGGFANNNNNNNNNKGQGNTVAVDASKINTEGVPFIGNANAPIIVAEWYDYQCPFCKRFHDDAIVKTIAEYVGSGKVKILFKDYAFLGPDSTAAALAGRAIWEVAPDKFYEWHEAMFVKQDEEHGGFGNKADVLALAQSLGIDSNKVSQLMASKEAQYTEAINADKAEGIAFGINGTPGTIVGNQMISGAQPYATIKAAIEAELNK